MKATTMKATITINRAINTETLEVIETTRSRNYLRRLIIECWDTLPSKCVFSSKQVLPDEWYRPRR